jgi:hypothetical protein
MRHRVKFDPRMKHTGNIVRVKFEHFDDLNEYPQIGDTCELYDPGEKILVNGIIVTVNWIRQLVDIDIDWKSTRIYKPSS